MDCGGGLTRDGTDPAVQDRRPIDLFGILADTLALVEPNARAKSVRFQQTVKKRGLVRANGDRLRLLLFKLIDNAVRYAPDSSPVNIEIQAGGDSVHLVVEDSGPGIPEEDLRFLFEYGRLIQGGLPDRSAGSGFGLPLVRWIAEGHGSSVRASRRPLGGSRFEVRLPRAQAPTEAV